MRVAVLSDMHGNCLALDAVLDDLAGEGIDQFVCLGDAIQGGPQPAETVARLRELSLPVVIGNADDYLLNGATAEEPESDYQYVPEGTPPPPAAGEIWNPGKLEHGTWHRLTVLDKIR